MRAILRTDVGRIRARNEDTAMIGNGFFVVCDGMGGHQAGDVASKMAVEIISRKLSSAPQTIPNLLHAIAAANEDVFNASKGDSRLSGMGTTLTAMLADEDQVVLAQVGDSRAYLYRGGVLRQCTHDHSVVAELVRSGTITKEQARLHPQKNLITRSLGTEPEVDVDLFEISRRKGDCWLLCSDGLTDLVTDAEMQNILYVTPLEKAADALLALALAKGGSDNITLLLVQDTGGSLT